jgi:transposase-like protein
LLSAEDQLALQVLGAAVRSAGSDVERQLAVARALATCRAHRDAGVPWTALARALGHNPTTLRRWRHQQEVPKPVPGREQPRVATIEEVSTATRATILALAGNSTSSSASQTQSSSASMSAFAATADTAESRSSMSTTGRSSAASPTSVAAPTSAAALPARPGVLVLTGDPRRGGNVFDVEVAVIRQSLLPKLITPQHLAMIELGEIASAIDRERPVILHVSAHNGPGGVVLSRHSRTHLVDPVEVANAIARADHQPTCLVLAFCGSRLIATQLSRTIPAIISWPADLADEHGVCFADEFYRCLAAERSVRRAYDEGAASVTSRHGEGAKPLLLSRWQGYLL